MLYKRIYNQKIELAKFVDDVYIVDTNGKKYLDLIGGSGTNYLYRYGDPKVEEILSSGFKKALSCTNFLNHQSRENLSDKLKEMTGLDTALFVCSGSEGNEAAVKLSLKRHYQMGSKNKNIVAYRNGCYFGRTFFSSCASNNSKYHDFLGDRRTNFVGFDSVFSLENIDLNDVGCVIMECFSSRELREITLSEVNFLNTIGAKYDIDLIFDEVKSGMGRTGDFMSYQKFGLCPDIVVGSKSIAAGLPLQAVMVSKKHVDSVDTSWYSSTTGGNPVFCDLAMYLMESSGIYKKGDLSNPENPKIEKQLNDILADRAHVIRIGDWWNIAGTMDMNKAANGLIEAGVIPYYIGHRYISLLPSRYFSRNHWDEFLDKIKKVIDGQ
jgi:acetylornithine/N-succinyldiaminopimelate aminotransferase